MKMDRYSNLLESILPGNLLNSSEKMYFDHLVESKTNMPVYEFFKSVNTRYYDVKKHLVEIKHLEKEFKKKLS